MAACTFFGHRDCPDAVRPLLINTLENLIQNRGVELYYVGNQGRFDALVRSVLRELSCRYPQIRYAVVLAYLPKDGGSPEYFSDTMLPEGIEYIHPRYALAWRNQWMLDRSDFVITWVTHSWGGAAAYAEKARKLGKTVINLA